VASKTTAHCVNEVGDAVGSDQTGIKPSA